MSEQTPNGLQAQKTKSNSRFNFLMIGSGQMFTAMVISGFIVGYFIDYLLSTTPLFMLICGVLGMVGGAQKVQRLVARMDQQPAKDVKRD